MNTTANTVPTPCSSSSRGCVRKLAATLLLSLSPLALSACDDAEAAAGPDAALEE